MYRVVALEKPPLPQKGPVILVCNHTSFGDPLVLLATAGRTISFLMAQEIYVRPHVRWVFDTFHNIPVRRKTQDVGAVRSMIQVLERGEVLGIFPEGGVDTHRDESGYPGVGYLALKTGALVVPASVVWAKSKPLTLLSTLFTLTRAEVKYGSPLKFPKELRRNRTHAQDVTAVVMEAIQRLTEDFQVNNG